jgi:hypothetical protein
VRRGTKATYIGRGVRQERGPAGSRFRSPAKKLNHKKAGGERQGKEGEKGDGEGGRGPHSPSTPIARQGDVSNTGWFRRSEIKSE